VQRVTAVHAAGRSTAEGMAQTQGYFAEGVWSGDALGSIGGTFRATTHATGEHATLLSQALAPPAEPLYANPWGIVSVLLLILALLLALLSGGLALSVVPGLQCAYDPPMSTCRLVGTSCIAGATTGGRVVDVPQRTVCWHDQGSQVLTTAYGSALDPVALARWLSVGLVALPASLLAGLLTLRRQLGARRRRRFRADYNAWQHTYAEWEREYYCHRCDGVFAPGERL
jgi:hypothetical protein